MRDVERGREPSQRSAVAAEANAQLARASQSSKSGSSKSSSSKTGGEKDEVVTREGEYVREADKSASERAAEAELIRNQYLGKPKKVKEVKKVSERNMFLFEWKAEDDTSRDANPLYQDRLQLRPMLGRGYLGGIDAKAQVRHHRKLIDRQRREAAENNRVASERERRLEKERLAELKRAEKELEDKALPGKHWSEKVILFFVFFFFFLLVLFSTMFVLFLLHLLANTKRLFQKWTSAIGAFSAKITKSAPKAATFPSQRERGRNAICRCL